MPLQHKLAGQEGRKAAWLGSPGDMGPRADAEGCAGATPAVLAVAGMDPRVAGGCVGGTAVVLAVAGMAAAVAALEAEGPGASPAVAAIDLSVAASVAAL